MIPIDNYSEYQLDLYLIKILIFAKSYRRTVGVFNLIDLVDHNLRLSESQKSRRPCGSGLKLHHPNSSVGVSGY